jgi:hypothetical protein
MTKLNVLSVAAASVVAGSAFAGSAAPAAGKSVVAPMAPAAESSMISGSVTLGYDSVYVYRGLEQWGFGGRADDLVTGALDLNFALSSDLSLNVNTWYGNSASDSVKFDDLEIYARLGYNAGLVNIGPSYKFYTSPADAFGDEHELGLEASACPIENLAVGFGAFYGTQFENWYLQLDANYTVKATDMVSVVLGGTLSYADYSVTGIDGSDFNHAAFYARLPINVVKNVTLTPYLQVNIPIGDVADVFAEGDNTWFGGAALQVRF